MKSNTYFNVFVTERSLFFPSLKLTNYVIDMWSYVFGLKKKFSWGRRKLPLPPLRSSINTPSTSSSKTVTRMFSTAQRLDMAYRVSAEAFQIETPFRTITRFHAARTSTYKPDDFRMIGLYILLMRTYTIYICVCARACTVCGQTCGLQGDQWVSALFKLRLVAASRKRGLVPPNCTYTILAVRPSHIDPIRLRRFAPAITQLV